jgi:hypothetical protein
MVTVPMAQKDLPDVLRLETDAVDAVNDQIYGLFITAVYQHQSLTGIQQVYSNIIISADIPYVRADSVSRLCMIPGIACEIVSDGIAVAVLGLLIAESLCFSHFLFLLNYF